MKECSLNTSKLINNMTNNFGYPDFLYKVLACEHYSGAKTKQDFSVTQFNDPANMTLLKNRHKDEIVKDVSDLYAIILGVGFHLLCEETLGKEAMYITEERRFIEIGGKIVSGQFDLYIPEEKLLIDFKVTKASSYMYGTRQPQYDMQMNLNRYILQAHGLQVDKMQIVELYRDFDKASVTRNSKYPLSAFNIIDCNFMTDAAIEHTLLQYIQDYNQISQLPDDKLPVCSSDDRWERDHKYAVMKHGNKRAIRVFDNQNEANTYRDLNCNLEETYIEHRPATPTRCLDWCEVNKYCPFYTAYMKKQENILKQEALNVSKENTINYIKRDLF